MVLKVREVAGDVQGVRVGLQGPLLPELLAARLLRLGHRHELARGVKVIQTPLSLFH